jgi:SAM-dependent methyltransferase
MNETLAKKLRIGLHRNLIRFGIDVRKKRPDRKVLEQVIFPALLSEPSYRSILFVGCAWYTLHYPNLFHGRDFVTMEISPDEAKYGGPKHIVDSCENIGKHFQPNALDVVVFNGVYGCGLNELNAINHTLQAIYTVLRPNGLFIFGWNDLPHMAPYRIDELTGLEPFEPYAFPPLNKSIHESDSKNRHRFHFYRRREHSPK